MSWPDAQVLECQDCGTVLRELTPDEATQVADHPDRFLDVRCATCRRAEVRF